jgi:hypothetical protein
LFCRYRYRRDPVEPIIGYKSNDVRLLFWRYKLFTPVAPVGNIILVILLPAIFNEYRFMDEEISMVHDRLLFSRLIFFKKGLLVKSMDVNP